MWLLAGAVLAGIFLAAFFWLWSAAKEYGVSSLEQQLTATLSNELAEGNILRLEAALSKSQKEGILQYAEIRQFARPDSWETIYKTRFHDSPAVDPFKGFTCSSGRFVRPHFWGGAGLVVVLPGNISGAECLALYIDSDLPQGFRTLRNRLAVFAIFSAAALMGIFFVYMVYWHKKTVLLETINLRAHIEKQASLSALAAQVAHDIRSPLAAIGAAAKGLSLPEDQRTLIDGALGRMNGIADDLLRRYRAPSAAEGPKIETHGLAGLIEQVIAEKRLQHKDKPGVKINFGAAAGGLKAAVDAKEFQRLVSNLVNNSVEALSGPGTVAVRLGAEDGKVLIEIKDDGKGIPPEILAKLGQKGETHGKAGGTGLGLYHARSAAESWGGGLKIESAPGKGTSVVISLPAAARPAAGLRAVLLDDDALVHMNWKLAAKAAGADLKLFKTPEELAAAANTLPRDIPLYIDSELGGGLKGEDIALDLHDKGFTDIAMATGHSAEKFSHLPWLKVTGKEPPWA